MRLPSDALGGVGGSRGREPLAAFEDPRGGLTRSSLYHLILGGKRSARKPQWRYSGALASSDDALATQP